MRGWVGPSCIGGAATPQIIELCLRVASPIGSLLAEPQRSWEVGVIGDYMVGFDAVRAVVG